MHGWVDAWMGGWISMLTKTDGAMRLSKVGGAHSHEVFNGWVPAEAMEGFK